jgi:hypothetical protein
MHQTIAEGKCFLLVGSTFVSNPLRGGPRLALNQCLDCALGNYQTKLRAPKIGSCADDARSLRFRSWRERICRLLEKWPRGSRRREFGPLWGVHDASSHAALPRLGSFLHVHT